MNSYFSLGFRYVWIAFKPTRSRLKSFRWRIRWWTLVIRCFCYSNSWLWCSLPPAIFFLIKSFTSAAGWYLAWVKRELLGKNNSPRPFPEIRAGECILTAAVPNMLATIDFDLLPPYFYYEFSGCLELGDYPYLFYEVSLTVEDSYWLTVNSLNSINFYFIH